MMQLKGRLQQVSDILQQKLGEKNILSSKLFEVQQLLSIMQNEATLYISVRKLLEIFVKSIEGRMRNYIEPIVTEALHFVFDQPLYFHLVFVTRRNQVEVDFIILSGDEAEKVFQLYISNLAEYGEKLELLVKESKNINDTYGGAVNQVLSCILRFVIAELLKLRGPIFLDEPSSAVHPTYAIKLGQLILSLSKKFGRQYIVVTHSKELSSFADVVYEVRQIDGISYVTKIED